MTLDEAIVELNVLSSYSTDIEKRQKYKDCINAILSDRARLIDFYKKVYIFSQDAELEENMEQLEALKWVMGELKKITNIDIERFIYND